MRTQPLVAPTSLPSLGHPPRRVAHALRRGGTVCVTVILFAAAPIGCDSEDPRGVAPAPPPSATTEPAPTGDGTDPASEGYVNPNGRRERTSTLGKAFDAAERTRDRIQERDAETGKAADEVFE